MKTDGYRSAFPCQYVVRDSEKEHDNEYGLTKREYIASEVMAGLMSKPFTSVYRDTCVDDVIRLRARQSVEAADALLSALSADVVEDTCDHSGSVTNRICDDCGSVITYVPD